MTKGILHITGIAGVLLLASCEKELDFEYHDIAPIPVIEGQLTQDGARVKLTMTTPMNEPMDRTPLTDASVTLADLTEGTSAELLPGADGAYITPKPGESGHEYRLTVKRDGTSYSAECLMREPTEITALEFNWIKMPYDHVAVLQVSFRDISSDPGDSYWVRVYRNGAAYMWTPVSDDSAEGGIIRQLFMTTRMDLDEEEEDTILREGDEITVTVAPVSKEFDDYLTAIAGDSNGPQMFSGPLCLGYFLAAPLAKAQTVFHPDQIPYF